MNKLVSPLLSHTLQSAVNLKNLQSVRAHVFGTQLNSDLNKQRTVADIMHRPLLNKSETVNYWQVPEIWDWPRIDESNMKWFDKKRVGIMKRVVALGKRGKGPIARAQAKLEDASAAGKKKKKK